MWKLLHMFFGVTPPMVRKTQRCKVPQGVLSKIRWLPRRLRDFVLEKLAENFKVAQPAQGGGDAKTLQELPLSLSKTRKNCYLRVKDWSRLERTCWASFLSQLFPLPACASVFRTQIHTWALQRLQQVECSQPEPFLQHRFFINLDEELMEMLLSSSSSLELMLLSLSY